MTKARPDVACDVSALARRLGGRPHRRARSWRSGTGTCWWTWAGRWRRAGAAPTAAAGASRSSGPTGARERTLVLELEDAAVATSGDYRKAWTDAQGRRLSHILDPRTGQPIAHDLASVTVVDRGRRLGRRARHGAAWCSGPSEGRALAARERLAARFVQRQPDGSFAEWSTPAFEALVAAPGARRPASRSFLGMLAAPSLAFQPGRGLHERRAQRLRVRSRRAAGDRPQAGARAGSRR